MHIVLCMDERNGMLFNRRRVSSDRAVSSRVLQHVTGRLLVSNYSAKLFEDAEVCIDDSLLENAGQGDTCFVENLDFVQCLDRIATITVYRWNRHYPADTKLPQHILDAFTLTESEDFPGNSHDVITEEKYVK